jgi:putative FmdB family regulatory protein
MPIYEYSCERCGEFEVYLPVSAAGQPGRCPECTLEARRRFSAPMTRQSSDAQRSAFAREERSRHEPGRASAPTGAEMPHRHGGPSQPWTISH